MEILQKRYNELQQWFKEEEKDTYTYNEFIEYFRHLKKHKRPLQPGWSSTINE